MLSEGDDLCPFCCFHQPWPGMWMEFSREGDKGSMRAPKRRREFLRARSEPPARTRLNDIADRVRYIGSPEHKTYPFEGHQPSPRRDANKCDPALQSANEITNWLADAVRAGHVGAPWETGEVNTYPRYVWTRRDGVCYEARLTNAGLGQYKGYPLNADEAPEWLS